MGVSQPPGDPHPLAAAAWMAGAVVSFTSMAVGGREVSGTLDTFELMSYRSLVGLAVIGIVATGFGWTGRIHARRMRLHLGRNAAHFVGQNLWFFALAIAPLAQVVALEFTSPLWVALLAPLFLSERLTGVRLSAAALGFTGTLIIAQPSLEHIPPGLAAAAGAAVCFATTAIFTKILTRTEPTISILFWLTAMQSVFGIVCAGIDGDMTAPSIEIVPWLLVVGIAGLSAHLCLTQALSIAPATVVMPLDFARLPVVALVGVALYGEPLGLALILGAAIIFTANWINITQSRSNAPRSVSVR